MPDTTTSAPRVVMGALGIGVSDLAKSLDFYTRACGMKEVRQYHLAYMEEVMVGFDVDGRARGPRLVLMHWTDGSPRNYHHSAVHLALQVPDAAAFAIQVRAAGYEVSKEPQPNDISGEIVGHVLDPDGYQVDFMQVTQAN